MVGTREHDAPDAVAPGPLIDGVQPDQIVVDDFGQWPFHACARQVDQNVGSFEQPVDHGGVAQITVKNVLLGSQRSEWFGAAGRTQIDAALEQSGRRTRPTPPLAPDKATLVMIYPR